ALGSPPPRWVRSRAAARAARAGGDPRVSGDRTDRRRGRTRARGSGGPGRRPADQAIQSEQAHGTHRHSPGWHTPPMSVWAAILAGGSGTRFWPLSTPERPKQLLPLVGERPLLAPPVERLDGLVPPERILLLTGPFLVDQVARTLPQRSEGRRG